MHARQGINLVRMILASVTSPLSEKMSLRRFSSRYVGKPVTYMRDEPTGSAPVSSSMLICSYTHVYMFQRLCIIPSEILPHTRLSVRCRRQAFSSPGRQIYKLYLPFPHLFSFSDIKESYSSSERRCIRIKRLPLYLHHLNFVFRN